MSKTSEMVAACVEDLTREKQKRNVDSIGVVFVDRSIWNGVLAPFQFITLEEPERDRRLAEMFDTEQVPLGYLTRNDSTTKVRHYLFKDFVDVPSALPLLKMMAQQVVDDANGEPRQTGRPAGKLKPKEGDKVAKFSFFEGEGIVQGILMDGGVEKVSVFFESNEYFTGIPLTELVEGPDGVWVRIQDGQPVKN